MATQNKPQWLTVSGIEANKPVATAIAKMQEAEQHAKDTLAAAIQAAGVAVPTGKALKVAFGYGGKPVYAIVDAAKGGTASGVSLKASK